MYLYHNLGIQFKNIGIRKIVRVWYTRTNKGDNMIFVTGGLGFVGSCFINYLAENSSELVVIIDEFGNGDKWKNIKHCHNVVDVMSPNDPAFDMDALLGFYNKSPNAVVHLGAISSTTETNVDKLWKTNVIFTRQLMKACIKHGARLVYSSTAATYGATEDFSDSERRLYDLQPMNAYAWSKHKLDIWAVRRRAFGEDTKIACIKPYNIFGCNELHKGTQKSLITKIINDLLVKNNNMVSLFHNPEAGIAEGMEQRDHVYVKDVCKVLAWLIDEGTNQCGIFNIGTGNARTWNDVVSAIETATGKPLDKHYVDMPEHLKATYQYYTQADLTSLREAGYKEEFMSLEAGIKDYIENHWNDSVKGFWL
jgi:ADP-L-glycero-D-manno-heptose 6-epimerase